MKNNNEALKKHHFWILVALAPVFVLLAVVFMMTGVSGAIEKANKEVTDADAQMKTAKAPGQGTLLALEANKEKLGGVRGQLWQMNWDKQAPFFTWPESSNGTFDKYNTMKFGTSFRDFVADSNLLEQFKPAYTASYAKLGDSITPTTFKGEWGAVLRWVRDWGSVQPDSKQLWLAMEDVWIQRAMLEPISRVNTQISQFTLVRAEGAPAPPAKKRKFLSRVWELDLEIAQRDAAPNSPQVLKGKLKNRTTQLQVLGVGSAMQLKVWLDPKMDLQPFEFRIEGAGVAGGDTIEIPPLPSHVIPPGTSVEELAKVVQVLDKRTVPIRRLDRLAIGYPSSRDATKELINPTFWGDAAPTETGGNANASASSSTAGPPGMELPAGPAAAGGAVTAAPRGRSGGLRLVEVADANRKRYTLVTEQLRRVPVAFTLVVDQMYVNDVLIAYANSALRFETSQVHWQRFTESLNAPATGGGVSESGSPMGEYGSDTTTVSGYAGSGLSSAGPPTAGRSFGGAMGMLPDVGTMQQPNQFGGIPGLAADSLSSVSEAQANSGLVQLTIYGLVTLYERFDAPKKEGGELATPEVPATEPAKAKPMDPKPADGETPKKETPVVAEKKPDAAVPEKKVEPMPEKKPEPAPPAKEPMK